MGIRTTTGFKTVFSALGAAAVVLAALSGEASADRGRLFSGTVTGPHGNVSTFERGADRGPGWSHGTTVWTGPNGGQSVGTFDRAWDREAGTAVGVRTLTGPGGQTLSRTRQVERIDQGVWGVGSQWTGPNGGSQGWSGTVTVTPNDH